MKQARLKRNQGYPSWGQASEKLFLTHFIVSAFFQLIQGGSKLTHVEGEVKDLEVKVSTKDGNRSDGEFCPPGHAKKGWC